VSQQIVCGNGLRRLESDKISEGVVIMPNGCVINLKDIAEEAGVSISTVSRVIKKKGEIAPETRDRILGIARRMGL